jgi:hypothetical protein
VTACSASAQPVHGGVAIPSDADAATDADLMSEDAYEAVALPDTGPDDADADASAHGGDADGELTSEDAYGAVALPDSSSDHWPKSPLSIELSALGV